MYQQTLPDKLVETNAALQSELKANIPIVPNLLSNQEKKKLYSQGNDLHHLKKILFF